MKWIFQRFFSPTKLCDIARIQCAAWTGFGVRHTPDSLCGMLRIMQLNKKMKRYDLSNES
jgi:hypothetical protein